jgi:transposase
MRGDDRQQSAMFSYLSREARMPQDHPLWAIRTIVDAALMELSPRLDGLYARVARHSIAPEKLLRAMLLQVLYTVRSERLLMKQLDYNLLFRWFVGLDMDDAVWDPPVFTRNRGRLLTGEITQAFFEQAEASPYAGAKMALIRLSSYLRQLMEEIEREGGREKDNL